MSKNTVTQEQIESIIQNASCEVITHKNKTTIVVVTLKNGFVIVESSSCVDPANYNQEIGLDICMKRIENKIWELEGYCLQKEVANTPVKRRR